MARYVRIILALIVLAGTPAVAWAQTGLNEIARAVQAMDKNFDAADKNHDGMLTRQEAEAGQVPFIAKYFDAIDVTHRGSVTKREVHTYIATMLMRSAQPPATTPNAPTHP
jgi:hypothetical protein